MNLVEPNFDALVDRFRDEYDPYISSLDMYCSKSAQRNVQCIINNSVIMAC